MSKLLSMENISKSFGGVHALRDVSLSLDKGQVHALIGKNGAGKSTLMKILAGVHLPDTGGILLNDKPVAISSPQVARRLGIAIVYQELSLISSLSVAENIYLGHLPKRPPSFVDWDALFTRAKGILGRIQSDIDPRTPVSALSVAEQQIVEIAKALSAEPQILILDEPTSALTDQEAQRLFEMIKTLVGQGVGIIYISHRLAEVAQIADYVSVLRDGTVAGSGPISTFPQQEIVRLMVGEQLAEVHRVVEKKSPDVVLAVKGLTRANLLQDIDFTLHRGEILGIAGLMGAGRTELIRAIFGLDPLDAGTIEVNGRTIAKPNPSLMKRQGLALVPEDRQHQGLVMGMTVRHNTSLTVLRKLAPFGFLSYARENKIVLRLMDQMKVKAASPDVAMNSLSGGNQQKVVLAKWLATAPEILLLDEPTRGIDVSVKAALFADLQTLAANGMSIIFISSELEEVMTISHRILTMYDGRIVGETTGAEARLEQILLGATGGSATL